MITNVIMSIGAFALCGVVPAFIILVITARLATKPKLSMDQAAGYAILGLPLAAVVGVICGVLGVVCYFKFG